VGAKYLEMRRQFTRAVEQPIKNYGQAQEKYQKELTQQRSGLYHVGPPKVQGMTLQDANAHVPASWSKALRT